MSRLLASRVTADSVAKRGTIIVTAMAYFTIVMLVP
jgi:hypothetical protein